MNGGTANIAYTDFRYAGAAINDVNDGGNYLAGGLSLTITDSSFTDSYSGIVQRGDNSITLQRNTFALNTGSNASGGYAVSVGDDPDLTGILLSGSNENTFTGDDTTAGVVVAGTIPTGSTWTVDPSSGATLWTYDNSGGGAITDNGTFNLDSGETFVSLGGTLQVDVTGTMNINPSVIVKGGGIQVDLGGALNATGTASNPVIFTSAKDTSVGGDTGIGETNDGSPAAGDYLSAIAMNGGTADVSHTNFRYSSTDIYDENYGGNNLADGSNLAITDSSFTDSYGGIDQRGDNSITLQRNHFALNTPGADTNNYAISIASDPDLTGIPLSGVNENTFTGDVITTGVVVAGSTVPTGSTWTVDPSSGATLWTYGNGYYGLMVNGTLNLDSGETMVALADSYSVEVAGTMNIADNVVIKGGSIQVDSGGTLNATGTSSSPVIFTSLQDSSVGGDTDSGGSDDGSPKAGDYLSAIAGNDATINANYLTIEYASDGISASDGSVAFSNTILENVDDGLTESGSGTAVYRGRFLNVKDMAIQSCDWGQINGCGVDAAYTYWGSNAGPFPSNGSLVCGVVLVNPWETSSSTASNADIFSSGNCDDTESPSTQLSTEEDTFDSEISEINASCSEGLKQYCDEATSQLNCIENLYGTLKDNIFISFNLPDFTLEDLSTGVLNAIDSHIIDSETEDGTGSIMQAADQGVSITTELDNDYNTCTSSS